MTRLRRIRITHIHPEDAYYQSRARYIGAKGAFKPQTLQHYPGYYTGKFYPDDKKPSPSAFFMAVRYKKI